MVYSKNQQYPCPFADALIEAGISPEVGMKIVYVSGHFMHLVAEFGATTMGPIFHQQADLVLKNFEGVEFLSEELQTKHPQNLLDVFKKNPAPVIRIFKGGKISKVQGVFSWGSPKKD